MCNVSNAISVIALKFRARGVGVYVSYECGPGTLTKSPAPDECYGSCSRCRVHDRSISRAPWTAFYSGPGSFSSNARTQRARRPLRFHRRWTLAGLYSATVSPLIDKTSIIFWESV